MNRTIKDATVQIFNYDDLHSLKAHVLAFVTAYNFAKHLKALKWRTPYQVICEAWMKAPAIFIGLSGSASALSSNARCWSFEALPVSASKKSPRIGKA